jgi:hypothetical protein
MNVTSKFQLPPNLMGHIMPHMAIASLIRIRPICKAGCTVTFEDVKCDVINKSKIILEGKKDPSTDLRTLTITREGDVCHPVTQYKQACPPLQCRLTTM